MKIYQFIEIQKAEFTVVRLCRVCEVARSAYLVWEELSRNGPSGATLDDAYLSNCIYDIWKRSRRRYGVPRVTAQLARDGQVVCDKKVARIMGELGIAGICGRRKMTTTRRDPNAKLASDLVKRHFVAEEADVLWVGDIQCRCRHWISYADRWTMPMLFAVCRSSDVPKSGRSA
jgi:putative transposase